MKNFVAVGFLLFSTSFTATAQTGAAQAKGITAAQPSAGASGVVLKGNDIYINGQLKGHYKNNQDGGQTVIFIYNTADQKVFTATHENGKDNQDWIIFLSRSNSTLKYNAVSPIESLLAYVAGKGIL
jgi:hypothetical protein